MPEREIYNYETGQWEVVDDQYRQDRQTADPNSNPYVDPSGGFVPGGTGPTWTDPDNAPPNWLYDPNAVPPPVSEPGLIWTWGGEKWELRQSPRYQSGTTTTPTTETVDPYRPTANPNPFNFDGGGFGGGGYNWPSYNAPGYLDPGPFDPGPAFTFREFVAPTGESMLSDPGFQFRLDQGRKALEASAAGKGVLRSGGTLKDILGYGQNFASQEYGNVYNRALQEYDTNRNNAADIWGKQYGQRRDVYDRHAGNVGQHNTFNLSNANNDFNARQRQAEMDFQDAYNRWAKQGDWLSGLD